jgi:integrase
VRINGDYGTKEFMANYNAALVGGVAESLPIRHKPQADSLGWLVRQYRENSAWTKLSEETRRTRQGLLRKFESMDRPYDTITKQDIERGLEARADHPSMARHFMQTARSLFKWAKSAGFMDEDPTEGMTVPNPKTSGYHVWTLEEVEQFEARWPIGTRERLAMSIMLYTGLRRGDASRVGKQHIRDGVISIKTEKTGAWVYLPIVPALAQIIEASKTGDLVLVASHDGRQMTKRYFGKWFKNACVAAGVPGTCHGLRKAGATRLAEAGATLHELNSIFGWTGTEMASLYTRESDKRRLAASGIAKLKTNGK